MLNDANFRLVQTARQLTRKFNGPTAKLIQDGYLTYQMTAIRRLCDKRDDVFSLRKALEEAEKEKPNFKPQMDQLLRDLLSKCDHVCTQVNKHIAHTARPDNRFVPWNMGMQHLDDAHQAICHTAIILGHDILDWADFPSAEIIPVLQDYFGEDLMLWVPEQFQQQLNQVWYDNCKRVNAWKRL